MGKIGRREFLAAIGAGAAATAFGSRSGPADPKYADVVLAEPHLVGYWPFDGSLLAAKGAHNARPMLGSPGFAPGPLGLKCLQLDGKSAVTMGETIELDAPDTTVEFFFRIDSRPNGNYNPCLVAKRLSSPETRFSVHIANDLSSLMVWNGYQLGLVALPDGPFKVGEWYHFVLAVGRTACLAYVNGVELEVETGAPLNVGQINRPLIVGASDPNGSELCAFSISDLAIYKELLSAKSVAAHMAAAGWATRSRRLADLAKRKREQRAKSREAKIQRRLNDKRLFARGATRVYEKEHLEAILFGVGGIGAGWIQLNGKGERAVWQIFNNFTQAFVPESFIGIEVNGVRKALQTVKAGGFEAMDSVRFRGEYPFAWYEFEDSRVPLAVELKAYSPMIPLNAKDSAIPCAVFEVTVENKTGTDLAAELVAVQLNAAGYTGEGQILGNRHPAFGGNVNSAIRAGRATGVMMAIDRPADAPGFGEMALAAIDAPCEVSLNWSPVGPRITALEGQSTESSPAGQTYAGAVAVPVYAKAGSKQSFKFVLVWHFPNVVHGGVEGWTHSGNMYANWWGSARDVLRYVAENFDRLEADTAAYHGAVYDSNLPHWLLDRVTSQMAILRSKTCFWAKDGYFGGWEGCNPQGGCCHGSCTHVWHYAQGHARLFPELARAMREATFSYQKPDGSLPHRHPGAFPATDGQLGDILGVYREHLCSKDGEWLKTMWPKARRAMDATIAQWDSDEDGVLAGAQWNTLDGALGGSTSWIGSLYLAALAASEKMAVLQGDRNAAERYRRIREAGAKTQNETLWNGEYYRQIPDPEPRSDYGNGCAIDQVLGEWWGEMLGIKRAYPLERIQGALRSIVKYNFQPDFHGVVQVPRRFVADDDPGTQMITWPKGPRPTPTILYGDEVMSGFEYAAAAAMVMFGLLREGYMLALAVSDRYDGRLRRGMTYGWDTTGNPFGDDECGKYYARAMSAWSLLLASQGFYYDGPAGVIGFNPKWQPKDHKSFFTGAEGWGVYSQRLSRGALRCEIDVRWGRLAVRQFRVGLPERARLTRAEAALGEIGLACKHETAEGMAIVDLPAMVEIAAGQRLTLTLGV